MSKSNSLHTKLVKTLEQRLKSSFIPMYDKVTTETEYHINHRHGEYDLLAETSYNGKKVGVFIEVKSNDKPKNEIKADYQLQRDYDCFKKDFDKVYLFYVGGLKNGEYTIKQYKPTK